MKQQSWWRKNVHYRDDYKNDYIVALIMHSFSWAFMIMLPIAILHGFNVGFEFAWLLILNAFAHGVVDNLKANKLKINLMQDQLIHIIQIIVTYFALWRDA